jgi:L-ascorbate metabolism protein UlaG (beta-lactamase superfamily)
VCLACAIAAVVPSPARAGDGGPFDAPDGPFPWPDGRLCGATLVWTGVAGLVLEAEGTRIAFDPFVTRPGVLSTLLRRARPDEPAVVRAFSGLDAVFVGHAHYDHAMDVPTVAAASRRARIHGGPTAVELLRRLGVDEGRLVEAGDGARATVGPFAVTAVASRHGRVPFAGRLDRLGLPSRGVPRTPFRWPRGEVLAWRVEALGRSLFVQGSAGIDDAALARQAPCDALFACLAARRGTSRYLERLVDRLRPSVLVPLHHDDFFTPLSEPPRPIATLRWDAFRREAAALSASHGTRVALLPRGRAVAW